MILPPAAAARFNVLQFMYPLQWSASGSLERSKRAFLISGTQVSHATVCYGSLADVIARCRISPLCYRNRTLSGATRGSNIRLSDRGSWSFWDSKQSPSIQNNGADRRAVANGRSIGISRHLNHSFDPSR